MIKTQNTDNETLLKLQDLYLKDNDPLAWQQLWLLSLTICKKIINKEKSKKHFFLSKEDFEDKAMDAVVYVLRRYKKDYKNNKKYYIKNFIATLYLGVIHSLYYQTDKNKINDDTLSLDSEFINNKLENDSIFENIIKFF